MGRTKKDPYASDTDDLETHLSLCLVFPKDSETHAVLAVGDAFFKKLFIRCRQSDSLLSLASACRKHSGIKIPEGCYDPHVSLLCFHGSVDADTKRSIEHELAEKGILAKRRRGGCWSDGQVWLVPTQRDIADWQPLARRSLRSTA